MFLYVICRWLWRLRGEQPLLLLPCSEQYRPGQMMRGYRLTRIVRRRVRTGVGDPEGHAWEVWGKWSPIA